MLVAGQRLPPVFNRVYQQIEQQQVVSKVTQPLAGFHRSHLKDTGQAV